MNIIKQTNNDCGFVVEQQTIGNINPEEEFPYIYSISKEKLSGIIELEEMETEIKKKPIQRIFLENNGERYYLKEIKESGYEFSTLQMGKCEW